MNLGGLKLSRFLQARFNIFMYLTFGWGLARLYIFFLGKLYYLIKRDERKSIEESVTYVLGSVKRQNNLSNITKKVFSGIFSHYYEKIFIAFEEKKRAVDFLYHHVSCKDLSVIKNSLLKGKGVILITGHYGAIEYIPTLLAINNINISMIAKFKTPQLRDRVFEQADKYGIRMIDANNKGNVLKKAINELKQNRVLVTQCDEVDEWRASEKKKTTFLGQVTGLDRTINILHKRTGAEVVFGVIHRFSLLQYKFIAYSHKQMIDMISYVPSITIGEVVLKMLEQFICRYPEQWYQWKKYPTLINPYNSSSSIGRHAAVPHIQPTFNIIL